jgi:uncharacterized protein
MAVKGDPSAARSRVAAYKEIALEDKGVFVSAFLRDPPQISELTFTNLFIWRGRYHPLWRTAEDLLLIIMRPEGLSPFGLPPVGAGDKNKGAAILAQDLVELCGKAEIQRADLAFVDAYADLATFHVIEDRDNCDYVYATRELIELPGNRFHKKKNHLNKFLRSTNFVYQHLDEAFAEQFLELQETWCEVKDCMKNPGLFEENIAVYEALKNYGSLGFSGGAILIDGKVEAFALGEKLNPDTAVIHIEKANPDIPGLYAAINNLFCKEAWATVPFVNREQDLGLAGLRQAKLSYNPVRLVEKFTLKAR